jgi:NADPH:quinone reductase-like Zn-dependent oxidoreductase
MTRRSPVRNSDLISRNLTWKGSGIDHWLATNGPRREAMTAEVWAMLRDGVISLPVAAVYELDEIGRAVSAASTIPPGAKVVIHI